jgi:hypothetical protein
MTSKTNLPRRTVLTAGLGMMASPVFAHVPGGSANPDFLAYLRKRRLYAQALHHSDGWCEGTDKALEAAFLACDDEFEGLARKLMMRPPTSWADVALRAEVARHWSIERDDGGLSYDDVNEMAAASLIAAVRAMTGEAYEVPIAFYSQPPGAASR